MEERKGGPKSRGNFSIGICLKENCANRDIRCNICIRFSEYERRIENVKSNSKSR